MCPRVRGVFEALLAIVTLGSSGFNVQALSSTYQITVQNNPLIFAADDPWYGTPALASVFGARVLSAKHVLTAVDEAMVAFNESLVLVDTMSASEQIGCQTIMSDTGLLSTSNLTADLRPQLEDEMFRYMLGYERYSHILAWGPRLSPFVSIGWYGYNRTRTSKYTGNLTEQYDIAVLDIKSPIGQLRDCFRQPTMSSSMLTKFDDNLREATAILSSNGYGRVNVNWKKVNRLLVPADFYSILESDISYTDYPWQMPSELSFWTTLEMQYMEALSAKLPLDFTAINSTKTEAEQVVAIKSHFSEVAAIDTTGWVNITDMEHWVRQARYHFWLSHASKSTDYLTFLERVPFFIPDLGLSSGDAEAMLINAELLQIKMLAIKNDIWWRRLYYEGAISYWIIIYIILHVLVVKFFGSDNVQCFNSCAMGCCCGTLRIFAWLVVYLLRCLTCGKPKCLYKHLENMIKKKPKKPPPPRASSRKSTHKKGKGSRPTSKASSRPSSKASKRPTSKSSGRPGSKQSKRTVTSQPTTPRPGTGQSPRSMAAKVSKAETVRLGSGNKQASKLTNAKTSKMTNASKLHGVGGGRVAPEAVEAYNIPSVHAEEREEVDMSDMTFSEMEMYWQNRKAVSKEKSEASSIVEQTRAQKSYESLWIPSKTPSTFSALMRVGEAKVKEDPNKVTYKIKQFSEVPVEQPVPDATEALQDTVPQESARQDTHSELVEHLPDKPVSTEVVETVVPIETGWTAPEVDAPKALKLDEWGWPIPDSNASEVETEKPLVYKVSSNPWGYQEPDNNDPKNAPSAEKSIILERYTSGTGENVGNSTCSKKSEQKLSVLERLMSTHSSRASSVDGTRSRLSRDASVDGREAIEPKESVLPQLAGEQCGELVVEASDPEIPTIESSKCEDNFDNETSVAKSVSISRQSSAQVSKKSSSHHSQVVTAAKVSRDTMVSVVDSDQLSQDGVSARSHKSAPESVISRASTIASSAKEGTRLAAPPSVISRASTVASSAKGSSNSTAPESVISRPSSIASSAQESFRSTTQSARSEKSAKLDTRSSITTNSAKTIESARATKSSVSQSSMTKSTRPSIGSAKSTVSEKGSVRSAISSRSHVSSRKSSAKISAHLIPDTIERAISETANASIVTPTKAQSISSRKSSAKDPELTAAPEAAAGPIIVSTPFTDTTTPAEPPPRPKPKKLNFKERARMFVATPPVSGSQNSLSNKKFVKPSSAKKFALPGGFKKPLPPPTGDHGFGVAGVSAMRVPSATSLAESRVSDHPLPEGGSVASDSAHVTEITSYQVSEC